MDVYQQQYQRLLQGIDFTKQKIEMLNEIYKELIVKKLERIYEIRRRWLDFFEKNFASDCAECGGHCCYAFSMQERFYLVEGSLDRIIANNKNFILPIPNFDLLNKKLIFGLGPTNKKWPCIFLGSSGCLLGDEKPNICLMYVCPGMVNSLEFKKVAERYKKDRILSYQLERVISSYLKC